MKIYSIIMEDKKVEGKPWDLKENLILKMIWNY